MYQNNNETQLPLKRKHQEYHDPDYVTPIPAIGAKRQYDPGALNSASTTDNLLGKNAGKQEEKYKKICEAIVREFQREIDFKHQQLEEIDERMEKAFHLLYRLRYAIVSEYYRKQTVLLTPSDANSIRDSQTLFDEEPHGPQMALHPSLKKIMGKKPKSYDEILRCCPTRAAAQTAKHTILVKSESHKKREKRLRQLIRQEGIVIDHSKDQTLEAPYLQKARDQCQLVSKCEHAPTAAAVKPLNATRLNNKTKHLIVVGNTSKYIGADEDEQTFKNESEKFSHKWLVYVQEKDPKTPLERFVKKVRFFLHYSYRPNDVVDIYSPPYQIARRGWGEFPVRIQMFFEDSLRQKPVQFIHNLVLDKKLSGLQTLGSETLVEIWLRSQKTIEVPSMLVCKKEPSNSKIQEEHTKPNSIASTSSIQESCHKNTFTESKDIDDNLFEFLNKIEETPTSICADIEKIQPTVMVTEGINQIPHAYIKPINIKDIEVKSDSSSTKANITNNIDRSINREHSLSTLESNHTSEKSEKNTKCNISHLKISDKKKMCLQHNNNPSTNFELKSPNILRIESNSQVVNTSTNNLKITPNNKAIILNKGNAMPANNSQFLTSISSSSTPPLQPKIIQSLGAKKILQKKLVQLVDADGNIKYLQMLVATSTVPTSTSSSASTFSSIKHAPCATLNSQAVNNNSTKPTATQDLPQNNATVKLNSFTTNVNAIKTNSLVIDVVKQTTGSNIKLLPSSLPHSVNSVNSNTNQTKNVVFQKEGKVYIIDPLQIKLKQAQKKQVSLLKPRVSLLKPKFQQQTPTVCDHDYVPTSPNVQSLSQKIEETNSKKFLHIRINPSIHLANITKAPFQTQVAVPQLHLSIKQARANAENILELTQQMRLQLEQQFLAVKFTGVRQAVEYLLRRLPLVNTNATKTNNFISIYPFIHASLSQFNNLPAFKQRSHEWLRARLISKTLRAHSDLRKLNSYELSTTCSLWSTREILMFARFHAYTPPMKGLNKNKPIAESARFTDLVKHEFKTDVLFETITTNAGLSNWIKNISSGMAAQEISATDNQIIDVVSADNSTEDKVEYNRYSTPLKLSNEENTLFLSIPDNLTDASELVSNICKETNLRLQPEEISVGVIHPTSHTIMASCVSLFVEKLLRQVIGTKVYKQSVDTSLSSSNFLVNQIEPQDVAKVLNTQPEYDFLSNRHLGLKKPIDD